MSQILTTWQLYVFLLLPDLALLYGAAPGLERGRLHPRAVPAYNLLHRPLVPVLLAAASPWLGSGWLVAAGAWAAHIVVDRLCGYGLRTPDGYQRG